MSDVNPIKIRPGRHELPAPISLAPARRKRRPALARALALSAAGLISAMLAFGLHTAVTPAPAALCYPNVQSQGGTLELRYYDNTQADRLSCEFSGREYPLYQTAEGEFRVLLPVKLHAKPLMYNAIVRKTTLFGKKVSARVAVVVKRGEYPHVQITLKPQRGQSKKDREASLASARKIVLDTLAAATPKQRWEGRFIFPLRGRISAPFGERRTVNKRPGGVHFGTDIGAPQGTDVVAANTGVVALTADFPLQGKMLLLDHGQGMFTAYFHMSEILAAEGQTLHKGQLLGKTGNTGRSTGPHLHWGAYVFGVPVNPLEWVERSF
ncbi:MAG: M23 family metallopeptidase [Elusimicrobia bacterium]|nr:M23 family metallopeptidase [Elusimicrobiota bacterium]